LLVIVSGGLALAFVEAGLRLFDPLGLSYFREASRYHLDKIADPVLVYKHRANLQHTYQGVVVSTNELGLRDRPLETRGVGELRLLLLGDSVTFGWGVPIEETFARKLEVRLGAQLGRRVRTVNAGVGSYNTVQEYAFLRAHHALVDPDVVALLYVDNDIEPNDPPFDPWSEVSFAGKSPPEIVSLLVRRSWGYRLSAFIVQHARRPGPARLDMNARGPRESLAALAAIADFCADRQIRFATFFYRAKGEPTDRLFAEVRAVGERHRFLVADVGRWWGDTDMRTVTNSTIDSHPNARGHEILASGMAAALVKQGLLESGR
jgi:hypothetical protein